METEEETNTEKGRHLPRVRSGTWGAWVVIYYTMFFTNLPPLISINMNKNSPAVALPDRAANSPSFIRLWASNTLLNHILTFNSSLHSVSRGKVKSRKPETTRGGGRRYLVVAGASCAVSPVTQEFWHRAPSEMRSERRKVWVKRAAWNPGAAQRGGEAATHRPLHPRVLWETQERQRKVAWG